MKLLLGKKLNLMDFESATKTSGSRFVFLKGNLAKLERAISDFMLDIHTQKFDYLNLPLQTPHGPHRVLYTVRCLQVDYLL